MIDTHDLIINGKVYKLFGVIHLEAIKNWNKLKGVSNWVNVNLIYLGNPINSDHLAFRFKTTNKNNLLNFTFP